MNWFSHASFCFLWPSLILGKEPIMKMLFWLWVLCLLAFYGCSGSVFSSDGSGNATLDELPKCVDGMEGAIEVLHSNGDIYQCVDGAWDFVSAVEH